MTTPPPGLQEAVERLGRSLEFAEFMERSFVEADVADLRTLLAALQSAEQERDKLAKAVERLTRHAERIGRRAEILRRFADQQADAGYQATADSDADSEEQLAADLRAVLAALATRPTTPGDGQCPKCGADQCWMTECPKAGAWSPGDGLVEALKPVIAVVDALDGQYGFPDDKRVDTNHFGPPHNYNDWPSLTWGDLRRVRQALSPKEPTP